MEVLLSNGAWGKRVAKDLLYGCWCSGKRIANAEYPPLDLLSIATHIRQDGHDTEISCNGSHKKPANADIVIISSAATTLESDIRFLKKAKETNPATTTIAFGAAATFQTEAILKSGAVDFAVMGEPEHTIRDLVWKIEKKDPIRARGIGYLEQGKVKINPCAPLKSLDSLPIPNRSLYPKERYRHPLVEEERWTTVLTSRGCRFKCTFCTSPAFYGGIARERSCRLVIEELAQLESKGYRQIFFRDEIFTRSKKRTMEICEGILKEKIDLKWIANSRIGGINRETAEIMKKAGCCAIKSGVESGDQHILNSLRKGITIRQVEDTFKTARKTGIRTHAHFIIGSRHETRETFERTLALAIKIKPTTATFNLLRIYPGTPLYATGEKSRVGMLPLVNLAYHKFYFRREYLKDRLKGMASLRKIGSLARSAAAIISLHGADMQPESEIPEKTIPDAGIGYPSQNRGS